MLFEEERKMDVDCKAKDLGEGLVLGLGGVALEGESSSYEFNRAFIRRQYVRCNQINNKINK